MARLLGEETLATAPSFVQDDILATIHATLQELYSRAPSWVSERTLTVNTTVSQAYISMPAEFVALLGPVSRDPSGTGSLDWEFLRITSRLEWLALLNSNLNPGSTYYYFLETIQQAAVTDSLRSRLLIYPVPTSVFAINFDAKVKPPTFTAAQMIDATDVVLPVPHEYSESVLLPIARWRLSSHDHCVASERSISQMKGLFDVANQILEGSNPEQTGGYAIGTPKGF